MTTLPSEENFIALIIDSSTALKFSLTCDFLLTCSDLIRFHQCARSNFAMLQYCAASNAALLTGCAVIGDMIAFPSHEMQSCLQYNSIF